MLEVTEVTIHKLADKGNLKAFAKVTINDALCLTGVRIVKGEKELFVAMPSQKDKNDKWRDIVYPINADAKNIISKAVLDAYRGESKSEDPF